MLELLFSLLLQLSLLQNGGLDKAADATKVAADKKENSVTTSKATTSNTLDIGSGGWDDKN